MIRDISVILRKIQRAKADRRLAALFLDWKRSLEKLPVPRRKDGAKRLLLIRLDDIGDYLLFRNFLPAYKQSAAWSQYEITFLGNGVVKPLFDMLDQSFADNAIWVDKKHYFNNADYRNELWQQLRNGQFDVVINPSRTRPLLLDDICMLAAGAPDSRAAGNTFKNPYINSLSDQCYKQLFKNDPVLHEFDFNKAFVKWSTGIEWNICRPEIKRTGSGPLIETPYILLCIGAAHKSRRWPVSQWVRFVQFIQQNSLPKAVIAGSTADAALAADIEKMTGAINITGKTTLTEVIGWMENADAAVCNDSMAAHLAISCNTPVIIVSGGNNYPRFTTYEEAGIKNAKTVYAKPFLKKWKANKQQPFWHYTPVTRDLSTVSAEEVFAALHKLLKHQPVEGPSS
ncbi:glycosyltransferase family 9 protein [Niabella ginsenosidivorans]|nr:glycosyltransferase family 9 protein [Niabella ginsenosidivorans]